MRIKVPMEYLDGKALKKAIERHLIPVVEQEIPIMMDSNVDEVLESRSALYDALYDHAEALVDLMKERSYAVFDFNFETKKAELVGVV